MGLSKCKDKRCQTWPSGDLSTDPCTENISNLNFTFCKISHVIYKLTCNICDQAYVGQTSSELRSRINNYRSKSNKADKNSTFELKHFHMHGFSNVKIQVLEQIMDENFRLRSENFYILRYKTLYPYGLNTKLNHHPDNTSCIYKLFSSVYIPSFKYNRGKRGGHTNRHFHKKYNGVIPAIILQDLHNLFNKSYCVNQIKTELFGMKFKQLRKLQICLQSFKCDVKQFKDLITDILIYKIGEIKQDFTDKRYFVYTFQQKSFDFLKLSSVLDKLRGILPLTNIQTIPTFKYTATLGQMLFNYRNKAQNLDKYIGLKCDCKKFEIFPFLMIRAII